MKFSSEDLSTHGGHDLFIWLTYISTFSSIVSILFSHVICQPPRHKLLHLAARAIKPEPSPEPLGDIVHFLRDGVMAQSVVGFEIQVRKA